MRGVRFGVSGDHDSEAEYLRHFFETVDQGLKDTLRGAPLFLAGVHEEVSLYRKAAKYPHILEAECHGNPEHSTLEQITKHAGAGAMREYRATCQRALQGLDDIRDKVVEPLQIIEAAKAGRVRQLFVAEDGRLPAPDNAEEDVLNAAVVEGLRTGAEVFSFPGKDIAAVGAIAAVLRY
jgi:stalled ribosome rescue protein Dom34